MNKDIKALIVGVGIIGVRHAKAQKSFGIETALYDISKEKAKKTAQELHITAFDSLDEALNWATLVHICVPDELHKDFVMECIKRNKHILCEKPLTTNLQDALVIQEITKKKNIHIFVVANNYRLTPSFLEIHKQVQKNHVGKIISLKATYLHDLRPVLKKTPWRVHQDFLYGGGIHAIDLVHWISSEKAIRVYAQTGVKMIRSYQLPEDYHLFITFASGMVAEVWANARAVLPVHRSDLEVYGEKGSLIASNRSTSIKYYQYKQKEKQFLSKNIVKGWRYTVPREIAIVNKFIQGKIKSHWPLPSLDEAVEVIRIVDAAERSIKMGKVVNL